MKTDTIWNRKSKPQLIAVFFSIFLLKGLAAPGCQQILEPLPGFSPRGESQTNKYLGSFYIKKNDLKLSLLFATLRALSIEIKEYEGMLEQETQKAQNSDNTVYIEKTLATLKEQLVKTALKNPEDYILPAKRHVTVHMKKPYYYGALLELEGKNAQQFKYYIAGIYGEDFSILEPGRRYTFEVYILMPKSTDLQSAHSYYVFVKPLFDPGPAFRLPDGGSDSALHF